jgi:hypothetical protein
LNTAGLAALVFVDHGIGEEEAERLFLLWKLEPAVREAQRARKLGVGRFPFLSEDLVYEGEWPELRSFDLAELARQVGLE